MLFKQILITKRILINAVVYPFNFIQGFHRWKSIIEKNENFIKRLSKWKDALTWIITKGNIS